MKRGPQRAGMGKKNHRNRARRRGVDAAGILSSGRVRQPRSAEPATSFAGERILFTEPGFKLAIISPWLRSAVEEAGRRFRRRQARRRRERLLERMCDIIRFSA